MRLLLLFSGRYGRLFELSIMAPLNLSSTLFICSTVNRNASAIWLENSVVDPKLFFSDPDPTVQEISDPDPTQLLSKETKVKF